MAVVVMMESLEGDVHQVVIKRVAAAQLQVIKKVAVTATTKFL